MRMLRRVGSLAVVATVAACGSESPPATVPTDAAVADVSTDVVTDVASATDASTVTDDAGEAPMVETFHPEAAPDDTPITAPERTWTWVPFANTACGNGEPTGIAVNLNPASRRVMIFLQGGGGCWDALLCYGISAASHLRDGYTATTFASERSGVANAPFFSRTNMANPWRDANLVFVPYCTGDIHGGDRIVTYRWGSMSYRTFHVGARNIEAFARRLGRTFTNPERVTLMGASAGGFGAGLNWDRVASAWPGVRVDMIDDSGPPLQPPADRWDTMRNAWNVQFPAGCPRCAQRLDAILDFYTTRFPPPARMAILSYIEDTTISTYFGQAPDQYGVALEAFAQSVLAPRPNARYYFVADQGHVLAGNFNTRATPTSPTVGEWLGQLDSDSPAWANVTGR